MGEGGDGEGEKEGGQGMGGGRRGGKGGWGGGGGRLEWVAMDVFKEAQECVHHAGGGRLLDVCGKVAGAVVGEVGIGEEGGRVGVTGLGEGGEGGEGGGVANLDLLAEGGLGAGNLVQILKSTQCTEFYIVNYQGIDF